VNKPINSKPTETTRICPSSWDAIPEDFKKIPQWVLWSLRERGEGKKAEKLPHNPSTGGFARISDHESWDSFEAALTAFQKGVGFQGVGFVLTENDPFTFIDIDNCIDGEGKVAPWAMDFVSELGSYTEVSPSGKGLHVFIRATKPGKRCKTDLFDGELEIYDRGRYATITGKRVEGTVASIEERQSQLEAIYERYFGAEKTASAVGIEGNDISIELRPEAEPPRDKLEQLLASDPRLVEIWDRSYDGLKDNSPSGWDLALAHCLARHGWGDQEIADTMLAYRREYGENLHLGNTSKYERTISKAKESGASYVVATTSQPVIVINNRHYSELANEVTSAMERANDPPCIFYRGGKLVRALSDEQGRNSIQELTPAALRGFLGRSAKFVKQTGHGKIVPSDPPPKIVFDILDQGGWAQSENNTPGLMGIIEAPALRPDYSLIDTQGYDASTKLYYAPTPDLEGLEIPLEPTRKDAIAAVSQLRECLADFPFDCEASEANMLGLFITPFVRPAISGCVPLAAITAPTQGEGKTLLATVASIIATGRDAGAMAPPQTEEEWRKSLFAAVVSGSPLILIDNLDQTLASTSLASAITSESIDGRILGKSQLLTLPQRATWIATGVNLDFSGDLPRRCYLIRLESKLSKPHQRGSFKHPRLKAWLKQNRSRLVAGVLTLCKAWYAAGCPKSKTPNFGSFESWAETVGSILSFAGVKSFLENLDTFQENADQDSLAWEEFLKALLSLKHVKGGKFTTASLAREIEKSALLRPFPDEIAEAIEGPSDTSRSLGKALSRRKDRRHGSTGIYVTDGGRTKGVVLWKIVMPSGEGE
jgi:hypothetical protein